MENAQNVSSQDKTAFKISQHQDFYLALWPMQKLLLALNIQRSDKSEVDCELVTINFKFTERYFELLNRKLRDTVK